MGSKELNYIKSFEVDMELATPIIKQYLEIKKLNPDMLMLYRVGDFYETFFEDAVILSKELELTLTGKEVGGELGRIPLSGIPAKSIDSYIEKLVQKVDEEKKKKHNKVAVAVGGSVLGISLLVALLNPRYSTKMIENLKKDLEKYEYKKIYWRKAASGCSHLYYGIKSFWC